MWRICDVCLPGSGLPHRFWVQSIHLKMSFFNTWVTFRSVHALPLRYSSAERHVECLHFLATVNGAAVSMAPPVGAGCCSLSICEGAALPGHVGDACLACWPFSTWIISGPTCNPLTASKQHLPQPDRANRARHGCACWSLPLWLGQDGLLKLFDLRFPNHQDWWALLR